MPTRLKDVNHLSAFDVERKTTKPGKRGTKKDIVVLAATHSNLSVVK
jgi:hypothetical protein